MSSDEQTNQQYLTKAVAWLRLRLQRLATAELSPTNGDDVPPVQDLDLEQAEVALRDVEELDPRPAMFDVAEQFGLSRFEQEVLLLCASLELDTRIPTLCAQAQHDPNKSFPTFALAMALFDNPSWEAMSPSRPLRYWRLIEIFQPGDQPLVSSSLRADERIVSYLKGINELDDRLTSLLLPLDRFGSDIPLSETQQAAVTDILAHCQIDSEQNCATTVQLLGSATASKHHLAHHVANTLGFHLYRLSASEVPTQTSELESLARLWWRESALLPIALYLDAHDFDVGKSANGRANMLARFVARIGGLVLLDTRESIPDLPPSTLVIDVTKPTALEQRQVWLNAIRIAELSHTLVNADTPDEPTKKGEQRRKSLPNTGSNNKDVANVGGGLASQFDLDATTIHRIVASVQNDPRLGDMAWQDCMWDRCLAATRPELEHLAQRIDAMATWDDIVLPDKELSSLRQIAAQVRHRSSVYDDWGFRAKMNRGLGITALFAGDSGTGKTMAAEVIANDLRLNLYRIDLSSVVSKYIGETEKNIRRVFDAAENGGAVLLFDEADALFGKRSEVKDSHDRYANIEINYVLQRMEAYSGLAILATNMKNALDTAFTRRLRFIVNFPFPGGQERQAIWQKSFPFELPTDELDYDRLARFHITGGSIHSVSLASAFLAAEAGTAVTMPIVLDAVRTEFRKLERPIPESQFRLTSARRHGP